MNNVTNENYQEFDNFMHNILGCDLKSRTSPRLQQRIKQVPFLKDFYIDFEELFIKFNDTKYRVYSYPISSNFLILEYLEEYYEGDSKKERYFNELDDAIYKIRDKIYSKTEINILQNDQVRTETLYDIDFDVFPGAIKYRKHIAYLVCDKKTYKAVKNVIGKISEKEVSEKFINIKREDFQIDGLYYFEIEENIFEFNFEKYCRLRKTYNVEYIWEKVLRELRKLRIPIFFYIDNRANIKLMHTYLIGNTFEKNWRKDLEKVFLSSWEANIARIFIYKNISWKYENLYFQLKTHHRANIVSRNTENEQIIYYSYRPDFSLDDKVIEVKGFWDKNSLEVVYCFKKEYPHIKLHIIDFEMYYVLEKIYASMIPEWEYSSDIAIEQELTIIIVGITRPDRINYVKMLKENDIVVLEREKDNSFDKNAIKALDINMNHLGYISKEWASIYAEKIDMGMRYKTKVKMIKPQYIEIYIKRINVEEAIIYDFLIP